MAAPKGNQYWKIRSRDGREKEYDQKKLLRGANKYFQWCQENPLQEEVIINKPWTEWVETTVIDNDGNEKVLKSKVTHPYSIAYLNKMRPFTLHGLCNFLEICINTFKNYEKDKEFLTVTTRIRQIIYNQKFEGAASGFLNPNIIARDLGLTNKESVEVSGDINIPIESWISKNNTIDVDNNSEEK